MMVPAVAHGRSEAALVWGRVRGVRPRPTLIAGLVILGVPVIGAEVVRHIVSRGAIQLGAYGFGMAPSHGHLLGTDGYGRDVLAMLAYGMRPTLEIGLVAGVAATGIGTVFGLVSGYARGWVDWAVRGCTDVILGLPVLPILVVIAAFLGAVSVRSLGLIIGLLAWPFTTRVVRAQVLSLRESEYVQIARLSGAKTMGILGFELLPNLLPYVMAGFVGAVSAAILASVGLQILGLGTFGMPTLGLMLESAYEGGALSRGLWWWWSAPTVLLIVVFIGLFLISLAIDEIANPRLRKKAYGRAVEALRRIDARERPPWARAAQRPVVEVLGLSVAYGEDPQGGLAVDDVSFAIEKGESFGLAGESGSGKTTTAMALLGLLKPPARTIGGRVYINGVDIAAAPRVELRRMRGKHVALIPQGAMNALNPVAKVGQQIRECFNAHGEGESRRRSRPRIAALLAGVGLSPEVYDMFPHELSGGMKQRVCIAMATALSPDVIVADEPTSSLDVVVQRQVVETLRRVQATLGAALLFIGHDLALHAHVVDRIGVMYRGRLVEIGPTPAVFADPRHAYTRQLIASVPTLPGRAGRKEFHLPFEGTPSTERAELRAVEPGHFAAV
jgi:peptide/nickel transport system permease protein